MRLHDKNFTLYNAMQELEARLIEQALNVEEGSVTRAARRLGMKHQSLSHLLRTRHKKLLGKRTPAVPRKQSIIKKDG
jgi:DNA-binding NtrC family response regulator